MTDVLHSLSVLWVSPARDALATVLWCLWLGVVLASVYAYGRGRTLGRAINALKEAGAESPETAKTASQLGLKGLRARALKSRDHLIAREGDGFYLPPETAEKARAVTRFAPAGWWGIPLTALLGYALLVAAWYVIPLF